MAYAWLFGILLGVSFAEGLVLICLACYVFASSGLPRIVGPPDPLPAAMEAYGITSTTAIIPAVLLLVAGILLLLRSVLILMALFIGKPFGLLKETADMTGVDIYSGEITKPADAEQGQTDEFGGFTGDGEGGGEQKDKGEAGSITLEDIAGGGGGGGDEEESDEGGGGGGGTSLMVLPENEAPAPPSTVLLSVRPDDAVTREGGDGGKTASAATASSHATSTTQEPTLVETRTEKADAAPTPPSRPLRVHSIDSSADGDGR